MDLWFTEKQLTEGTEGATVCLSVRIKTVLYREKSEYQEIAVFDTYEFGRMLVLDGIIQLTEADEFMYHEMLAHVPLCAHPAPERVLVVGGGDGGTVREICKHPGVRQVVLAELDPAVVAVSRAYFPGLNTGFADPRVEINYINGIDFVNSVREAFDVIIVDSPDPLGPAADLFGAKFYRGVSRALRPGGIMVAQCESPFLNRGLIRQVADHIRQAFPLFRYYLGPVPTYPGGLWGYAAGSKEHEPCQPGNPFIPSPTRYYTPEIQRCAFTLPPFVQSIFT